MSYGLFAGHILVLALLLGSHPCEPTFPEKGEPFVADAIRSLEMPVGKEDWLVITLVSAIFLPSSQKKAHTHQRLSHRVMPSQPDAAHKGS